MRDAERRFETLKMRIEERTYGARGGQIVTMDIAVRHPGQARVVTTERSSKAAGSHELWITDGQIVRTYSAAHRWGRAGRSGTGPAASTRGTSRARPRSTSPSPRCPWRRWPSCSSIRPATARTCWRRASAGSPGTDRVAGREAIVVECDHPRAVEQTVDRPDYHVQVAADRIDGFVLRLVESVANEVTRVAEVIHVDPDAALPPTTFDFEFPEGTTLLY